MKNKAASEIRLQDYAVPNFFIETVDLCFELDPDSTLVKSKLSLSANPKGKETGTLVLMGEELELVRLSLNQKTLSPNEYVLDAHSLQIPNVPNHFELEIETRCKPLHNTALSGLYVSSANFCTQCEAEGFRRITYFLDRPDVMAKYTTTIIANQKQYPVLLSNGNLIDSGPLDQGRHFAKWVDPFKKPSYLFALVAGDLDLLQDTFKTQSGREVSLRIYVEKGYLAQTQHAMQAVKKAMRWDEENYGREYDLDIYMIVAVSDFNMGAMENKGLNIFNTRYILADAKTATDEDFIMVESVIAHEYFHNWTGNRITCRDWFQLSLKEGLTIFRDQSFTADTTSRTVARIKDVNALRTQQFPEDAGPLAHAVRPNSYQEINNFYTATVYNKGAEVIRMMKTLIGEAAFKKAMNLYFDRFDGQAVTIDDFAACMQEASGKDLSQFKLWYSQAGTPILEVEDHYDAAKKMYTLKVKQSCPASPGQPNKKPYHIPFSVALFDDLGKEIQGTAKILEIKADQETFEFPGVSVRPIPSLLRNFSAPVRMNFAYSDADIEVLFKHDTDKFNRWEAGQKFAIQVLMRLVRDYQEGKSLQLPSNYVQAFQHVLLTQQADKVLLAEMLTLPSEKYLAELMDVVDPDAIHAARDFTLRALGEQLKFEFLELYQENHDAAETYAFTMEALGRRRIKNLSLAYLMKREDPESLEKLAWIQFQQELKANMTDCLAALRALSNVNHPLRAKALELFYETWKGEALVVDKWFSIQALSDLPNTLETVMQLVHHEAFDIKNPNKVYALIGAFTQNAFQFHQVSGKAYAFLGSIVQQLDSMNPQIAARMVKPLTTWKRFDEQRQECIQKELKKLAERPNLSRDVYEMVSKSLEEVMTQS